MLDPQDTWVDEFKKISPADTPIMGIINLADVIEKLTNKVEPNFPAADSILPGIFKWNKALFVAQMLSLVPTQAPDWIPKVANAWMAASMGGIITPGTVTAASIWGQSTSDILTVPAAATTIPTIAVGQAAIITTLSAIPALTAVNPQQAQELFAKSFFLAVSAFSFILIGLAPGIPPIPVPMPVPAR